MSNKAARIESIDLLRGVVIVIMVLDHVRGYFHADVFLFDPTDLTKTSAATFFTRWITHFCAPAFVLLAGTSAALTGQRKSTAELSKFLLTRGLWLMFLEMTIINFGWFFNPHFDFNPLQVIWALGVCMVVLAGLVHLPGKLILAIGLIILFGHNALDGIHFDGNSFSAFLWAELHEPKIFQYAGKSFRTNYPVLPWIGIIALGYSIGGLFTSKISSEKRRDNLMTIGLSSILLFLILRGINMYGNLLPWSMQKDIPFSIMSFLNTTKYPPSLQFALMTLGPAMIFLSIMEKPLGKWAQPFLHFGRVPMFFYIIHIFLIHFLVLVFMAVSGVDWHEGIITKGLKNWHPKNFGYSLTVVYTIWLGVILFMYPLCKWYDKYKTSRKDKWWLSYL